MVDLRAVKADVKMAKVDRADVQDKEDPVVVDLAAQAVVPRRIRLHRRLTPTMMESSRPRKSRTRLPL